ncbi:uncharacterized protein LOC124445111 [Xenia sp. Carnegie-2017]|uniref:uncharacterized protein LOC124445111 n=1 Tax=Xenia sp. Carnegie-2017 TaxID=2897299 RepID=UPI001F045A3E|nr:uncharacterized protein LOC124445111 [Xenia sp. Carnegie-2017]
MELLPNASSKMEFPVVVTWKVNVLKFSNSHLLSVFQVRRNKAIAFFEENAFAIFIERRRGTNGLIKRSNGTYLYKHELLQLLRNIANSTSQIALQKIIDALKNSHLWKESLQLQKYFDEFWGLHLQKWVRFYRDESLRVAIYTNNGVERQNNWLKDSYLEDRRNHSISDLVNILLTQFLPDSYKKYKEQNIKSSDSYMTAFFPQQIIAPTKSKMLEISVLKKPNKFRMSFTFWMMRKFWTKPWRCYKR